MSRRTIATVAGVLAVAVVAGALVINMLLSGPGVRPASAQEGGSDKGVTEQRLRVEVTRPTRRALTRELRMPATLLAYERVDLYAKVSGYIGAVHVDIGSRVRKGDVLIEIDVPEMADELRQAEAELEAKRARVRAAEAKLAQAELMIDAARAEGTRVQADRRLRQITLKRKQELREGKAIPQQDLDVAESESAIADAQLKIAQAGVAGAQGTKRVAEADVKVAASEVAVARATVARLKTLIGYATIKAPFDGVITDRFVDPGAFVRSAEEGTTTPLLSLARTDRIRLALDIPESDAPSVRTGTKVVVQVRPLGNRPLEAAVSRTAGVLKPDTRTMRAEVDLDNEDGRLAPGMYAQVVVKLEVKARALLIPAKAVRVRGRDTFVLVARDGIAGSIPVEVGYDDGIWAEIVSGLDGGESIITSATGAVAPGAPVKPVPVGPVASES